VAHSAIAFKTDNLRIGPMITPLSPGPGLAPADHDGPVALGQRLGDVLGQLPPHADPEEAGVAVAPAVAVLDAGR
jgi:hypothetical protein